MGLCAISFSNKEEITGTSTEDSISGLRQSSLNIIREGFYSFQGLLVYRVNSLMIVRNYNNHYNVAPDEIVTI